MAYCQVLFVELVALHLQEELAHRVDWQYLGLFHRQAHRWTGYLRLELEGRHLLLLGWTADQRRSEEGCCLVQVALDHFACHHPGVEQVDY